MVNLFDREYIFPDFKDKKILVSGIGGGCDVISAFVLANYFQQQHPSATIVYSNTKRKLAEHLTILSYHIAHVPEEVIGISEGQNTYGTTAISESLPRGAFNCPLIISLPDSKNKEEIDQLVQEIKAYNFDYIIGVDGGGDSLSGGIDKDERDKEMFEVLKQVDNSVLHVVFGLCCDGETKKEDMEKALEKQIEQNLYKGYFTLETMLDDLKKYSNNLGKTRTPQIIISAIENTLESNEGGHLIVPRYLKPEIPKNWLTSAFVFSEQ